MNMASVSLPLGGVAGRRPLRLRQRMTGIYFFAPFLAAFAVATIAPVAYSVYLSLFRTQLIGGNHFVGLANYGRALRDPLFWSGVWRVARLGLVVVPVMLALATLAALALDSGRLRFPRPFRLAIFLPYAVPGVVGALMWGYLYGNQFGLAGQFERALGVHGPNLLSSGWLLGSIGNIVLWESLGFNMLIFFAALQAVPSDIYEAATIDGCGEIRKAWSIKLPALKPALGLTLILSIIGMSQLFTQPSVLYTIVPQNLPSSYTPNFYAYNLAFNGSELNYAGTIALVLGLITAVLAFLAQRFVRRSTQLA